MPFSRKKKNESDDDQVVGSTVIDAIDNELSKGTLVVHNVTYNEGKTHNIKGGEQLVNEMLEVICSEVKQQEQQLKKKESTTNGMQ